MVEEEEEEDDDEESESVESESAESTNPAGEYKPQQKPASKHSVSTAGTQLIAPSVDRHLC